MIKARTRKRDGRRVYEVRLRAPAGREYSRTFDTKKRAVAFEASERSRMAQGAWIDPRRSGTPLAALVDAWLASNPAKRSRTLERDRQILEIALAGLGSSRSVTSVPPA